MLSDFYNDLNLQLLIIILAGQIEILFRLTDPPPKKPRVFYARPIKVYTLVKENKK